MTGKATTPREHAAERALATVQELRTTWQAYREARRWMQSARNTKDELVAVRKALVAELRIDELLGVTQPGMRRTTEAERPVTRVAPHPDRVLVSPHFTSEDIPGRPGWPVESEDE